MLNENEENKIPKTKIVSKHKESGIHSLEYDSIFRGKKDDIEEDEDTSTTRFLETFDYEPSSNYYEESINNFEYVRRLELKQKVYTALLENTDINFSNNRRKPS